jgi:DNA replication and repair protein RecF
LLLVRVELRDFRSYAACELVPGPGLTVLHGPNGAGKSNLLEAICFACTGHSPRTRSERQLIHFGARSARVEASVSEDGELHRLSVGYGPGEHGEAWVKRMRADGVLVPRMTDVHARPLISVFLPDRLALIKGPPAGRRAHLDRLMAALWPLSAAERRAYAQALAQRNALLQRIRSRGLPRAHLTAWDHELARHALTLRAGRARALELLAEPFAARACELGLAGTAALEYRPGMRAIDFEGLLEELGGRLPLDLERGFSTHGPHRDELRVCRDGRDLRTYGSQGEQRLAVLALLLAERDVLARERGTTPLMLLDDVMSELDPRRRELLAAELARAGQSIITSTDPTHVPGAAEPGVTRLRVAPGTVLGEARAA